MTDPRLNPSLLTSARALRFGSAIILRHYDIDPDARRALFRRLRRIARQRGHMLFLAGDEQTACRWGADGVHGRAPRSQSRKMPRGAPVHNRRELRAAARSGADWLFVSPVYATRSHPGEPVLGAAGFARLAKQAAMHGKVVALGGMNERRFALMRSLPVQGWAAIDALKR